MTGFVYYLMGISGTVRMLWESFFPEAPGGTMAWVTAGISLPFFVLCLCPGRKRNWKILLLCFPVVVLAAWRFRDELKEGVLSLYQFIRITAWNHFYPGDMADRGRLLWEFPETLAFGTALFVFAFCLYLASAVKISRVGTLMLLIQPLAAVLAVGKTPSMGAMSLLLLSCIGVFAGNHPWQERGKEQKGIWVVEHKKRKRKRGLMSRRKQAGGFSVGVTAACGVLLLTGIWTASWLDVWLEPQKLEARAQAWDAFPILSFSGWSVSGFPKFPGTGSKPGELSNQEEIRYTGQVMAEVTLSERPEGTIYLKNYHGSLYNGYGWDAWKEEDSIETMQKQTDRIRDYEGQGSDAMDSMEIRRSKDVMWDYVPYDSVRTEQEENRTKYLRYRNRDYSALLLEQGELLTMSRQNKERCLEWPAVLEPLKEICEANPAKEIGQIREFIVNWLSAQCAYDLQVGKYPEEEDPILYFLFEKKKGYCQHFASAAVMMFRMYGVPARYTTGLAVSEDLFQKKDDSGWSAYPKDSCAHAWVEIWQDGLGWIPVEVTPGGAGAGTARTEAAGEADRMDTFETEERLTMENENEPEPSEAEEQTQKEETPESSTDENGSPDKNGQTKEAEKETTVFRKAAAFFTAVFRAILAAAGAGIVLAVRRWVILAGRRKKNYSGMFENLLKLLAQEGLLKGTDWLGETFAEEVCEALPWAEKETAAALAETQAAVLYGRHRDTEKERRALWTFYLTACRNLCERKTPLQRLRFRLWECWY